MDGVPHISVKVPELYVEELGLPRQFVFWEGQEDSVVKVSLWAWIRSRSFLLCFIGAAAVACVVSGLWWVTGRYYAFMRDPAELPARSHGPWARAFLIAGSFCVTAPLAWVVAVFITSLDVWPSH